MAMMTALTSAVSGMKAEQSALDVISNNISNVNTIGYKAQTVSFSDLLSQTIQAASASTSTKGSTNAQQIGLGVQVSSTTTDTSAGSTETSSSALSVALSDSNTFLVVQSDNGSLEYTRDGEISIDDNGYLTINGYKVCGWTNYVTDSSGDKVYNTSTIPSEINVYSDSTGDKTLYAAAKTTEAGITGHISSADTSQGTSLTSIGTTYTPSTSKTIEVFDSQGNETDVNLSFTKCATQNGVTSWYWETSASDASITPSSGYIAFNSDGNIITSYTPLTVAKSTSATTDTTGYSASNLSVSSGAATGDYTVSVTLNTTSSTSYTVKLTDPSGNIYTDATSSDGAATFKTSDGATITLTKPSTLTAGTSTFTVASGTTESFADKVSLAVSSTKYGTGATTVSLDLSKLTSSSASDSISCDSDGNAAGTATGTYSINQDGTVSVTYTLTDGSSVSSTVGQLGIATFRNAGGLEKDGNNLYTTSSSSGDPTYVAAGEGGTSTLSTSALELSNVDLSSEFSNMMISQRAYQASSKVITTSDSMLQSLINMVG